MKSEINWQELQAALNPPRNQGLDWSAVGDQFSKVAFDVYKRTGEDGLWELREVDGHKFLFALYNEEKADSTVKTAGLTGDWAAYPDRAGENVTLLFKGTPVYRFGANDYEFAGEAGKFASWIAGHAGSDVGFVQKLASMMSPAKRAAFSELLAGGADK